MAFDLYSSAVNNTGLDPLQGFDFNVYVQDTSSGKIAWFGLFQSLTLSIRNATETYLELGQRNPIYLDGEIQIAWVLEQGLIDMAFVQRTFGVSNINRDQTLSRGPRFQITFDANAAELVADGNLSRTTNQASRLGSKAYSLLTDDLYPTGSSTGRAAVGRYEINRCKVDSVSLGIMPGRRVAAIRWEGVAEGIKYIPGATIQTFKTARTAAGTAGSGFLQAAGSQSLTI